MTRAGTPRTGRTSGGLAITGAVATMNLATYAFTVVAARLMGPGEYGALAGLMATLLMVGVLQLGLQTTAARRIAAAPHNSSAVAAEVLRLTTRAALVLGLVMLAAAPLVTLLLRLDSIVPALVLAASAVPLTMMGGQAGILQGERRWVPLALVYVAAGVPRLLLGTAAILLRPEATTAVLAVFLGALAPVVVGHLALRGRHAAARRTTHEVRGLWREVRRGVQVLSAFLVLSSIDVIVARSVLDGREAGLYAGGLILTKAVLFLPQFVVVVAYPSLASPAERSRALRQGSALVLGLGAAATLGAAILPGLALVFVGGGDYADIQPDLWLFALLGTVLSLLQLVVYAGIARQAAGSAYVLVAGVVGVVVAGILASSVLDLLLGVLLVDVLVLAVLATRAVRALSRDQA
ncbi:MAG: oligosaccharide flippase family protein [Nocardioides sp.]|nr:oligosaccharide flippase family protein [Nocardioides sp.]